MNLMKKERYVIIVAGGKGKRMQNNIPKQFLEVGGKPLIMRSVEAFFSFDNQIKIVLVLPKSELSLWIELCSKHQFRIACKLVEGGKERFFSVKKGQSYICLLQFSFDSTKSIILLIVKNFTVESTVLS